EPDLIAAGKIIGGGFPIGAIGGSRRVVGVFDGSTGKAKVAQGGTFSANPISMVAGRISMEALTEAALARLEAMGDRLRTALTAAIERRQAHYVVSGAASLFRIHPKRILPRDYRECYPLPNEAASMKAMGRFFQSEGVILPMGATACLSTAMTDADIDKIVDVFEQFLALGPISEGEAYR
ncbi:aminotransferase class III-fold pyridoxal phosphate-dependent enzyme, partial [Sinorhizobium meliloti]|nr:aminotransferase class III-fold pyridoxal phosphate-dependent enzyme [Sinorhizobium meliloti]